MKSKKKSTFENGKTSFNYFSEDRYPVTKVVSLGEKTTCKSSVHEGNRILPAGTILHRVNVFTSSDSSYGYICDACQERLGGREGGSW